MQYFPEVQLTMEKIKIKNTPHFLCILLMVLLSFIHEPREIRISVESAFGWGTWGRGSRQPEVGVCSREKPEMTPGWDRQARGVEAGQEEPCHRPWSLGQPSFLFPFPHHGIRGHLPMVSIFFYYFIWAVWPLNNVFIGNIHDVVI